MSASANDLLNQVFGTGASVVNTESAVDDPSSNAGVYGNHSNDFQSKYENSNVDHPYLLK